MAAYEIHDSHGFPQCGVEILEFETFGEIEEFLETHLDVTVRIAEGYAALVINEEE